MNKRFGFLVVILMQLCCNLLGQHTIVKSNIDSTLVVISKISEFAFVESIQVKSAQFYLEWHDKPIPDSITCDGIYDMTNTCAVLYLPLITNLQTISDSIVVMFGSCFSGAIQVRQMILLNINSGKLLGWYAYFTGRGADSIQFLFDKLDRVLIVGAEENQILDYKFYVIDRHNMVFHLVSPRHDRYNKIRMRLYEESLPIVSQGTYFEIRL